jgi:tRNA A37 threonylcarbamoyladenosine synthetase subunit TsaC/SUA5/YrdC
LWEEKNYMDNELGVFSLAGNDALTQVCLSQASGAIKNGGLVLLPSDTSWALAVSPFRLDSLKHLETVLPQKVNDPIPLSFGSKRMLERYVKIDGAEERLMENIQEPLTVVCEVSNAHEKAVISAMLHTNGTIGARLSTSPIERQLSTELDRPVTTCAVRDDSGAPVRSFDDALAITRTRRSAAVVQFPIVAIRVPRLLSSSLSTVVTLQRAAMPAGPAQSQRESYYIFREGAIGRQQLERALRRISPSDCTDMT